MPLALPHIPPLTTTPLLHHTHYITPTTSPPHYPAPMNFLYYDFPNTILHYPITLYPTPQLPLIQNTPTITPSNTLLGYLYPHFLSLLTLPVTHYTSPTTPLPLPPLSLTQIPLPTLPPPHS